MARSDLVGFSIGMARSWLMGFSFPLARSFSLGFSLPMARSPLQGFSLALARSAEMGFFYFLARSDAMGFSSGMARSSELGYSRFMTRSDFNRYYHRLPIVQATVERRIHMEVIGVLFDIDALGGGWYGPAAYGIFCHHFAVWRSDVPDGTVHSRARADSRFAWLKRRRADDPSHFLPS